jgi:hypothetical protein
MKTFKTSLFVILVALVSVTEPASGREPTIALCIAVPTLGPGKNEREVAAFDVHSHFQVILLNISGKPQRIVTEGNSWGYDALSFEFTDQAGKKFAPRRKTVVWTRNNLRWWLLQPQESLVLEVYFADSQRWQGFPNPPRYGDSEAVTLRAVFEIKPNEVPPKDGLWTGRVLSKPGKYVFFNRTLETK